MNPLNYIDNMTYDKVDFFAEVENSPKALDLSFPQRFIVHGRPVHTSNLL